MAKRIEALARPELLVWARKSAGYTQEQAAKRAAVPVARLQGWEAGTRRPTVNQLRKLANLYKRPLAVFYLPTPPKDFKPLHDYRRLPGEIAGIESPQLRLAVRYAHDRRLAALEMTRALGERYQRLSLMAEMAEAPETLAAKLRQVLGVSIEEQLSWPDRYSALHGWREALERLGILVFQFEDVPPAEARAFSISASPLPVIAVNTKDAPSGRVFSMLHEFCHLALRRGGLCDLDDDKPRPRDELQIEVTCNGVAGAILVPREHLLRQPTVSAKGRYIEWEDTDLASLARQYKVSREVVLRRLLLCGLVTKDYYQRKRNEYLQYEETKPQSRRGFAPPHKVALGVAGRLFTRLVLESYHQESISARDVADLLNIRLQHLHRIELALAGRAVSPGAAA